MDVVLAGKMTVRARTTLAAHTAAPLSLSPPQSWRSSDPRILDGRTQPLTLLIDFPCFECLWRLC